MNKQNVMKSRFLKVGLSLGLLLPSYGFSEYADYSSQLSDLAKDTSAVGSVLKPTPGSSSGTRDSFKDQADKIAIEAEAKITQDKTELETRQKVRNWTKKNDTLKSLIALPDILMQKALKDRQADIQQGQGLLGKLGASNIMNPQDFSTNGLPNACRKNVDFSQLMQATQQLGSEPFKYVQAEATKLLTEKDEKAQKAIQAKIGDIMKHFKELANKDDEEGKADALKGPNQFEARLARLKASAKKGADENKELKNSVVDIFTKFTGDLSALKKNDGQVQQIGDEFAKSIENSQRAAMMAAQQNVDQLYTNCKNEVKLLKQEIENFKGHLAKYLVEQKGVEFGLAQQTAEADTQAQRARVANMQCQDVTQDVQATLMGFGTGGTDLSNRLSSIRSEKNPTKLLQQAVSAMQDVQNIQLAVGQKLQPLKDDCSVAGNGRESLKQRFQQIGGGAQGQQGQGVASSSQGNFAPRGASRAAGNNANHAGGSFVPGFGRLN